MYKIGKYNAIIKNSFLHESLNNVQHVFYKHRYDSHFNREVEGIFNPLNVYFSIDENVYTVEKSAYTILEALSNIGGLLEIISYAIIFLFGNI